MRILVQIAALASFILASTLPVSADEIGPAIRDIPIFDVHMHYKEPAWGPYPVKTVIELMDKSGVAMAAVSSTPDEGTIKIWEYAPHRMVPVLRPYHGNAGSSNWTKSAGMLSYLRGRLSKYAHAGIGEFHVNRLDPSDRPLLAEIAKIAKARNIIIHVHSSAAPVRLFYELEPGLKIIWAHAGMTEPPEVIGSMLDKYPTLFADTSYREYDILSGNSIDPAWLAVIKRHADRLMIGTDTWVNSQWDDYEGLIASNRAWLSKLPRSIAERIAYKNASKLFKRKISRDLLGKR